MASHSFRLPRLVVEGILLITLALLPVIAGNAAETVDEMRSRGICMEINAAPDTPEAFLQRLRTITHASDFKDMPGKDFVKCLTGIEVTLEKRIYRKQERDMYRELSYWGIDRVLSENPAYHLDPRWPPSHSEYDQALKHRESFVIVTKSYRVPSGNTDYYDICRVQSLAFNRDRFCITPRVLHQVLGVPNAGYWDVDSEHIPSYVQKAETKKREFRAPIPEQKSPYGAACYAVMRRFCPVLEVKFFYSGDQCASFMEFEKSDLCK